MYRAIGRQAGEPTSHSSMPKVDQGQIDDPAKHDEAQSLGFEPFPLVYTELRNQQKEAIFPSDATKVFAGISSARFSLARRNLYNTLGCLSNQRNPS